ncbi:MAG: hypothetical protein ABSC42_07330 [Tepidisphaeraceae bacterium]|jgi:hypothetical protein
MKVADGRILALLIGLCAIVFLPAVGDGKAATKRPTTLPAKTGAFEITFTQRSPGSEYSKLLERTGASKDELGPDYKLADEPFVAYVPPDYDGSKPFGVVVQSFQDGSPDIFEAWRPVLDEHHLMMFATKKDHLPFGANTGVCLDAVYNLRQSYNIDPTRVYLFGLSKYIEPVGLSTGDVFTGGIYAWWCDYYAQVGTMAPLVNYKPSGPLLRLAKTHVQVLAFHDDADQDDFRKAMAGAMRSDGFDHVALAPVGHDELLSAQWFDKMLKLVESVKAPPPTMAAAATSQPAPDAPLQLLHLAQAYLNSGFPDRARDKLNLLIQKYPNDPAAAKARELLGQLNSQ